MSFFFYHMAGWRQVHRMRRWILLMLCGAAASSAHASCSFLIGTTTDLSITVPRTLIVPRDAAIGTVIYTLPGGVSPNPAPRYTCSGDTYGIVNQVGAQPASGARLFPIGTTGLSFVWWYKNPLHDWVQMTTINGPLTLNGPNEFTNTYHGFALVKTGPIAGGATVPGGVIARWDFGALAVLRMILSNAIQVGTQTCTPQATNSQAIRLDTVATNQMNGIGTTSPRPVNFFLGLDCTGYAGNIMVTFTDANTPGNRSAVLSLGNAAGSASGIGLQLRFGDKIISYGADSSAADNSSNTPQFLLFTSTGSEGNAANRRADFTARYVQTANKIEPGTVAARSTFTFSYQ